MNRAYAIKRPVENEFLVRQRDRRIVRELLGFALIVLVLGGALLAYTWVHIEILRTGYEVTRLEKELHTLTEQERRLRLEAARLSHPQRVKERAIRDLGMETPKLEQTVFYQELMP